MGRGIQRIEGAEIELVTHVDLGRGRRRRGKRALTPLDFDQHRIEVVEELLFVGGLVGLGGSTGGGHIVERDKAGVAGPGKDVISDDIGLDLEIVEQTRRHRDGIPIAGFAAIGDDQQRRLLGLEFGRGAAGLDHIFPGGARARVGLVPVTEVRHGCGDRGASPSVDGPDYEVTGVGTAVLIVDIAPKLKVGGRFAQQQVGGQNLLDPLDVVVAPIDRDHIADLEVAGVGRSRCQQTVGATGVGGVIVVGLPALAQRADHGIPIGVAWYAGAI